MKVERMILLAFLGDYVLNNITSALAALVPANPSASNPYLTAQYITYVVLALITVGIFAWWYLARTPRIGALMQGLIFGVVGFVTAVVTALVSGFAGVILQTGSISQAVSVLPNFGPYLVSVTTLILLVLWVVPGVAVGWFMQSRIKTMGASSMPRPMI
jgi:hypothetical protein